MGDNLLTTGSVGPLEQWAPLPFRLAMAVKNSYTHPAVKTLFDLWGSMEGTVERHGMSFAVDPDDPSVSTEFQNGYDDYSTLSLSTDSLSLQIVSSDESLLFFVPAQDIKQIELYEAWGEHIHLKQRL